MKNYYSMVYQIAFTLAANLLIFFFIGSWLDRVLHTKPLFLILGVIFSFFGGMYLVFKMIQDFENTSSKPSRK